MNRNGLWDFVVLILEKKGNAMKKSLLVILALSLFCLSAWSGEKKYTVGMLVFQEDMYFKQNIFGAQDFAKQHGIELLVTNTRNNLSREAEQINTYATRGVNAIIGYALSFQGGSINIIDRVRDKGVITALPPKFTGHSDFIVGSSHEQLGANAAIGAKDFIIENFTGKTINIAILGFRVQGAEANDGRIKGFMDELRKIEGVTVNEVGYQDGYITQMAMKKATDMMTANPEINFFYCANEGGTVGATMAVKNMGRQNKIFVCGTDASEQTVQFLLSNDNILQSIGAQKPYDWGWAMCEAVFNKLEGNPGPAYVNIDSSGLSRANRQELNEFLAELKAMSAR